MKLWKAKRLCVKLSSYGKLRGCGIWTDLVLSVKARDSRAHKGGIGVGWGPAGWNRRSNIRRRLIPLDIR